MRLFKIEKKQNHVLKKSVLGMIFLMAVCGLLMGGCAKKNRVYTSVFGGRADTSHQLTEDRYLGILHDQMEITDDEAVNRRHSEFHVFNRTPQAMTIDLSGPEGNYTLVVEPKRDKIWLINPGTYHVEVTVPGFPPTAADTLVLSLDKKYKWEIWMTEH